MFTKKWIAVSLTAAMLAANLTMPVTSLSVMGADTTQQEVTSSVDSAENLSSAESQESSAQEPSDEDITDEQEISTDQSESDSQGSETVQSTESSEEEDGTFQEDGNQAGADQSAEAAQETPDASSEEEETGEEPAGQEQTVTGPDSDQEVQAGPVEEVTAEEPVNGAQTAADGVDENQVLTAEPMTQIVIPAEDCGPATDNNDVFAGYVNRELGLSGDLQFDTGDVEDVTGRMEKAYASTRLTGNNRTIYAILLREIKKVAAGERSDTVFSVTQEELGVAGKYWTAADLGVSSIVENDIITQEAMKKLNEKLNISFTEINKSLLADCPYDLYWYDKTNDSKAIGFKYQATYINGEPVLMFSNSKDYTFSFPVAAEYSAAGQENTNEVKTDIGTAVQTAFDTAQSIVSRNVSKSDFEKMKAYKDEICDLVDYNFEAADENYSGPYGNPWQLIWVFDNDASTKVVCEGYSKSFQYLCDLTSWNDIFKECISVTGGMDGGTGAGGHMWNIVSLRDGSNYLVDVTNCDNGSIGQGNGRSDLFLVGTGTDSGSTVYAQGNIDDGYYFPGLDYLSYAYYDDTRTRFGDDILTLSAGRVTADTTAEGPYSGDHTHIYAPVPEVEATCTEEGHSAGGQCSICSEYDENYKIYPKKDHTPGEWTVSREPSYDREGEETTACTVCGTNLTRPIDKLVSETSITLDETEAVIETGSTKQLTATVLPEDAHDRTVTWSSSNTDVATVTSTGLVSAVASGSAVITAQTSHLGLTATCEVVVSAPALIDINDATVSGVRSQPYNGEAITPNPVVKMGSVTLTRGTDYDLSYSNNTDAGRGTINIIGMGQYTNVKKVTFAISPAFISNVKVTGITEKTYDGSAQTQDLVLEYNSKTLTKNTDYTLTYERNINVGTARILISGRDNFTGTALKSFQILPKSIENDDIDDIPAQTYTGDACEPSVTVTVNEKALTPGTDFTVSYSSNVDAGTATATVSGTGNYTGKAEKTFTINPKSISGAVIGDIAEQTYTGSKLEPAVSVTLDGKALTEGTDYTVSYNSNVNAGTATVTITGTGNYTGTAPEAEFTINPASIEIAEVTGIVDKTYDGSEQTQTPVVKVGSTTLTEGTDYTVSCTNNVNAGTATVTVTGTGNYTGNVPTAEFTINPASIESAEVSGIVDKTYDGSEQTQTPVVKVGSATLTEGTDYTVSYSSNIDAGTATVTITGTGNYTGSKSIDFTITDKTDKISIGSAQVEDITGSIYNGMEQKPAPVVKVGSAVLAAGTDYTVSYSNNINAGTATVTITGNGRYTGSKTIEFTISPASVSTFSVTGISNRTYNGAAQTQAPVVKLGSRTLAAGTDYTVSYSNNINAGTAAVIITGKGNYTGTVNKTFAIAKAAQSFSVSGAPSVESGKTTKINAAGAKETSTYYFVSSNTSVASAAGDGTVTGINPGTASITISTPATANYNAASWTVNITVYKNLKKPGYCHFVKWNNKNYTGCRIAWNSAVGAEGYQTQLCWTNGSHESITHVGPNVLYRDCKVYANHVSLMRVRAFYTFNGQRIYGPWSNMEFITPSPTKLTCKNVSVGNDLKMKVSWPIIYGSNGYNVFITTNPNGKWSWNQSTAVKANALSAVITKYQGGKLKKNTRYYVRIVTRRKFKGVFCSVPMPAKNTYVGTFVIK